jgi:hypothetical protein
VAATISLELSGLQHGALKLGKRVHASGDAGPASLAGAVATIIVERRTHGEWHKIGAVTATIAGDCAYSRSYKPAKRGAYRVRVTIAATEATSAAATTWRKFTVK